MVILGSRETFGAAMQYEQRLIHEQLCQWGGYEEGQYNYSAYASVTPLYRYMTEGNQGQPIFKSRILSNGTPLQVLLVRQAVQLLPSTHRDIISAKYVFQLKPEGGLWTDREKAELLGLTYNAYNTAIHRARAKLLTWL